MASNDGMTVHWFFPGLGLCDEYCTGDDVIDTDRDQVDCPECIEWIHA